MHDPIPHVQPGPVSLAQLAKELNQLHVAEEASARVSLKRRIRMGKALLQIQSMVGDRNIGTWIGQNFQGSRRTAFRRMAEARRALPKVPDLLSMDEIDELIPISTQPSLQCQVGTERGATPPPPKTSGSQSEQTEESDGPPDFSDDAPATGPPAPSREPGDDTETAEPENAKPPQEAPKKKADKPPKPKPSPDDPLLDSEGQLVPEHLWPVFQNAKQFDEALSMARKIQASIHDSAAKPGGEQLRRCLQPTGTSEKLQNRSEHLNALSRDIKFTKPHAVCPWCQGKQETDCKGCAGLGWVTSMTWKDRPAELRA